MAAAAAAAAGGVVALHDKEARQEVDYVPSKKGPKSDGKMTAVAPKVELEHASSSKRSLLPPLFDRASHRWWSPQFDSEVLEQQLEIVTFSQKRRRFRVALFVLGLSLLVWEVFLLFNWNKEKNVVTVFVSLLLLILLCLASFALTLLTIYRRLWLFLSTINILLFSFAALLRFWTCPAVTCTVVVTELASFVLVVIIIMLAYTLIPLPLYVCVSLTVALSIIYEVSYYTFDFMTTADSGDEYVVGSGVVIGRIFLHICLHILGIYCFLLLQAHTRGTFWKVGLSVMDSRNLEVEKHLKENMIHSLMPPKFAQKVMSQQDNERKGSDEDEQQPGSPRDAEGGGLGGTVANQFRAFNVSNLDNVSILFADIVGFTRMSSNKTADHLVRLLNDLFGRFDKICSKCDCEKISTLGDCYYATSGCPDPNPNHAQNCVRMGLQMIEAIIQFDKDNNEDVDMRVGVHTGSVLMGIVGTKRFKFDVWSHDVTLANEMESSGQPGRVHISADTYKFLKDDFLCEEGQEVEDTRVERTLIETYDPKSQGYIVCQKETNKKVKTYFIIGPKVPEATAEGAADATEQASEGDTDTKVPMDGTAVKNVPTVETSPPAPSEVDGKVVDGLDESEKTKASRQSTTDSQHLKVHSHDSDTGHSTESGTTGGSAQKNGPVAISMEDVSAGALFEMRRQEDAENVAISEGVEDIDFATMNPFGKSRKDMKQFREKADRTLVEAMQKKGSNVFRTSKELNTVRLSFTHSSRESKFRQRVFYTDEHATFSTFRFSLAIESLIALVFFLLMSSSLFFVYGISFVVVFIVALIILLLTTTPFIAAHLYGERLFSFLESFLSRFIQRHIHAVILLPIPAIAALFIFLYYNSGSRDLELDIDAHLFTFYALVISLTHFANISAISSWLKSLLATVVGVIVIILVCVLEDSSFSTSTPSVILPQSPSSTNMTTASPLPTPAGGGLSTAEMASYTSSGYTVIPTLLENLRNQIRMEILPIIVSLLVFIWALNREIEIADRFTFSSEIRSADNRRMIQREKEQVDSLFANIIPSHVVSEFTQQTFFARNHTDVGVIFASISNFADFYEESFEGGLGYLRVLNEIIGDFENLSDDPKFKDIEKIKTIAACLMCASGLNESYRSHNKEAKAHLYGLMDYSLELLNTMKTINASIFNFNFDLKIGLNIGDITSGVIGSTKLHYDIWGDTVNVASRMYSTGTNNKIQVTKATYEMLEPKFEFKHRGKVQVKGKGELDTYLVVGKKKGATWQ